MENLVKNYFKAKEELHAYFEYVPNWVEIPMEDYTNVYWGIVGGEGVGGDVWFCYKEETLNTLDNTDIYDHCIYTQRFLKKWVYRGKEFTMISVDTQTDGNKFLGIFDNTKERDTSRLQDY